MALVTCALPASSSMASAVTRQQLRSNGSQSSSELLSSFGSHGGVDEAEVSKGFAQMRKAQVSSAP